MRLIQLATPSGVYIVDLDAFGDRSNGNLRESNALAPLRELLAAHRPVKIAHNAKFDAKFIKHTLGADLGGVFDTLLASQLTGSRFDFTSACGNGNRAATTVSTRAARVWEPPVRFRFCILLPFGRIM